MRGTTKAPSRRPHPVDEVLPAGEVAGYGQHAPILPAGELINLINAQRFTAVSPMIAIGIAKVAGHRFADLVANADPIAGARARAFRRDR